MPILAYHSISENLFGYSHPYYQINTSPGVFGNQMRWLRNAGYQTMEVSALSAAFAAGDNLLNKIVLTFDDGYRDFLTEAWPVMHQCGFTATVFLATDRIQNEPTRFEGAEYLTWQDIHELQAEGISFGSHTASHADLRSLGPEQIDYELGYSKETIEQHLGVPVKSFAYPFPFPEEDLHFVRYLADALENLGYQNGVSTIIGRAHGESDPFFFPRLPVNSWDDAEFFLAKLRGGYDWLHWPQLHKKMAFHNEALMQHGVATEPGFKSHYNDI